MGEDKAMKTNRVTQSSFTEDLEATPLTSGVAILNKEKFVEILKFGAF